MALSLFKNGVLDPIALSGASPSASRENDALTRTDTEQRTKVESGMLFEEEPETLLTILERMLVQGGEILGGPGTPGKGESSSGGQSDLRRLHEACSDAYQSLFFQMLPSTQVKPQMVIVIFISVATSN